MVVGPHASPESLQSSEGEISESNECARRSSPRSARLPPRLGVSGVCPGCARRAYAALGAPIHVLEALGAHTSPTFAPPWALPLPRAFAASRRASHALH